MSIRIIIRNSLSALLLLASCKSGDTAATHLSAQNGIRYEAARISNEEYDRKGVLWLRIKLLGEGGQSPIRYNTAYGEYTGLLDYYLNHAQEDIHLEACGRKIAPVGYWFENNYNLVGFDVINVGFDTEGMDPSCADDGMVVFNDRNFKNGIIKLSY